MASKALFDISPPLDSTSLIREITIRSSPPPIP
jgi:hypothetical protein